MNFVVSAALSLASGRAQGEKVPRQTLREAYRLSKLSTTALPYHCDPAESVEALLGYAWIRKCLSSEFAVELIYNRLSKGDALEKALAFLVDYVLNSCLRG
ncbi:hypothetical protein IG193_05730 [Infirmifilum lucidum]|uniref:Uncharacterized protein n=1 Tax=Infirmifilum lucidum TaxID=2776706 RepID=A0A7L9FEP3_9CREN|nr:hypothetical protein IG193_05730 [Infirmifilum lucidum]